MTIVTLFVLSSAFVLPTVDYQKAMEETLSALDEASGPDQLTEVANRFERIARAEQDQWLPWYYAAYATLNVAIMKQDPPEKDPILDQAQQYLDQALVLAADESEVVALQGYIHTIRVTVDPATRGQQLAPEATRTLVRALKMNPDNPRALYLLGQMQYGTAQFFGADTAEACQLISQAVDKYEEVTPENVLMPDWGKENAQEMSNQCGK